MDMPSRPTSPTAESVQPTVEPTPPVLPTITTTNPEPLILSPVAQSTHVSTRIHTQAPTPAAHRRRLRRHAVTKPPSKNDLFVPRIDD